MTDNSNTDVSIMMLMVALMGIILGLLIGGILTQSSYEPVDSVRCNGGHYVIVVDYDDGTTAILDTDVECER